MDINEIDNSYRPKPSPSMKANKDHGFKKIMNRKMAEINATTPQPAMDTKADVLVHSDKLINLLDDYARELIDPAKTLKDIEPLVENIKEEVSLIEAEAADNTNQDHELERFIKDLAVTANVAVFKFYRGDYL
jgi:hypothetical protein